MSRKICFLRCVAIKIAVWVSRLSKYDLSTFSADSSGQLDVFWHNGDPLGVDGAKIGVFEESDEVCFGSLLESSYGCALESEIGFEILSDFTD